jgi:hypothetical protein
MKLKLLVFPNAGDSQNVVLNLGKFGVRAHSGFQADVRHYATKGNLALLREMCHEGPTRTSNSGKPQRRQRRENFKKKKKSAEKIMRSKSLHATRTGQISALIPLWQQI